MSKKTTELSLVTNISNGSIKPKPTKRQIIEALVVQARTEHRVKKLAYNNEIKRLGNELKDHILASIKKSGCKHIQIEVNLHGDGFHEIDLIISDAQTMAIKRKAQELTDPGYFCEHAVKQDITTALATKNPLLAAEYSQALSDMLNQITSKDITVE